MKAASCTSLQQKLGHCATSTNTSASTNGKEAEITATTTRPVAGEPGTPGRPGAPGRPLTKREIQALLDDLCYGNGQCATRVSGTVNPLIPVGDPVDPVAADPAAVVTIRDVARFLPATTGLHLEPDGWAVVGVPANLWIEIAPATVDGEVFGRPAQVRFTPVAYRFDYGDGVVRTSAVPGASWGALGQEELTATPTSHVYTDRGARQAAVTVVYAAEYRFGDGGFTAIAGAVSGTTPPERMLVVVERTALTTPG
ncbi:hypothetical protein [uncultured Amnibacterium sp.]|uniref:hypothetical protein n=1 Tax=uncultured Amnibacterium sp. TaxID=1631851 RepID=UPI0035CBD7CF